MSEPNGIRPSATEDYSILIAQYIHPFIILIQYFTDANHILCQPSWPAIGTGIILVVKCGHALLLGGVHGVVISVCMQGKICTAQSFCSFALQHQIHTHTWRHVIFLVMLSVVRRQLARGWKLLVPWPGSLICSKQTRGQIKAQERGKSKNMDSTNVPSPH